MDEPEFVSVLQAPTYVFDNLDRHGEVVAVESTVPQESQQAACGQRHYEPRLIFGDIENGHHIRVIEALLHADLATESLDCLCDVVSRPLEGDIAAVAFASLGFVHIGEAATADVTAKSVWVGPSSHRGHPLSVNGSSAELE